MRATEPWELSEQNPAPSPARVFRMRRFCAGGLAGAVAIALGGCAQQPTYQRTAHSKEYFPGSIYGKPSPRVVAYGEPVPRGGGVYMVGEPYSVAGRMFFPTVKQRTTTGLASWYGVAFHGRRTANGEVYDCDALTAAHPTMPLPSYARVTNLENRRSLIVRVNDRGPFHENRILDVSRKTAEILDFHGMGTTRVKVEYVAPAGLAGSDDTKLLATLRTDGPAILDGRVRPLDLQLASALPSSPSADLTGTRPSDSADSRTAPIRAANAENRLASSSSADPADSRPTETASAPTPPIRAAVLDPRPEPASHKGAAIASAAPLPPMRPDSVKMRVPSLGSKATQMARANSDKSLTGH